MESLSLGEMREESGLDEAEILKFQELFGRVRQGVDRDTLTQLWELLKDKTDQQLETLVATYISSLPEEEKRRSTLPATYEALHRVRLALKSVFEKPVKQERKPSVEKKGTRFAPERNSGQELNRQLERRLAGKANDGRELQMAVDEPEQFWRMMEQG